MSALAAQTMLMQLVRGGHDFTLVVVALVLIIGGVLCEHLIRPSQGFRAMIYVGIIVLVIWVIFLIFGWA